MAEATSIRKAIKKLRPSLDAIKAAEGDALEPALRDFHQIIGEIEEVWTPGEISEEDELITGVVDALTELKEYDQDFFSSELVHVLSFISNSTSLWSMRFEDLNSEDKYESIFEILQANRPLNLDSKALDIIFRAARALDRYDDAALFLSSKNIYFEPVFKALVENEVKSATKGAILDNFLGTHNDEAAITFLTLLKYDRDDTWARLRIVELLEKKSRAELIEELEKFEFERIEDLQEFRNMGYLLMRNELPQMALSMTTTGLKLFQEDYELLKIKAEALLMLDEKVQSYEIFKQLAVRNNSDLGSIKNAINLAFQQKLYDECQNIIETYPEARKDPLIMARKIDCELQTSKFHEAMTDLDTALAEHPGDKTLLELKLKALIKLNKESEAFNLARDLMEEDPTFEDASDYAMNWLYKREEYKSIVGFCDESDILRTKYRNLCVACILHEEDFKAAMKEFQEDPELLNDSRVIDAIFFNVRDSDLIEKLIEIHSAVEEKDHRFKIVMDRLLGNRPRYDDIPDSVIAGNTSKAVAYIIASDFYSTRSPQVPDRIRSMLYQPIFKEIRAMMDFITSIYEGKFSEDVLDSPKYLFPLTEAYIKTEHYGRAESQLQHATHSEDDPFYKYCMALVDFHREEYTSARRFVEGAMAKLKNADFLRLAMTIAVYSDDYKNFKDYVEEIVEMKQIHSFDFSDLYHAIVKKALWDMASFLVNIDTDDALRNQWIVRFKRDLAERSSDYNRAVEASSFLFTTNQYLEEDVHKHVSLLSHEKKLGDVLNFLLDLETENKSPWLEVILGDTYYGTQKYTEALDHYTKAIAAGEAPENIRHYADTLMEAGKFDESSELIEKSDNKLLQLKLYQKTSNIPAVMELLSKLTFKKKEEQDIVRYAAENLWYNRDVRDFLVNTYRQEGYVWLGKIIAVRTYENKDTKLSIEVARNLNKNNPEDLDIVLLYTNILIGAGQREDAIQLILQSLKYCREFERCLEITNSLLRLYYEDRDYASVVKFYETNPKFVDQKALQFVIRSYMEADDFDMAEKLMSRYEGTLLSKDVHNELREDLKTKKEFMETIFYVSRLLKLEYKIGKRFDKKEAFYKADIPIEHIESVYEFLASRDFYFDVNEEKYEILTRDVIQKAAKNTDLEGLRDLSINVIFNNLERKDPVLARNVYIYIKDQMDIARRPKLKDDDLLKLLRIALRENIKQEPLHVAFHLKIGISEALDVITLMEYMSRMNREGEN